MTHPSASSPSRRSFLASAALSAAAGLTPAAAPASAPLSPSSSAWQILRQPDRVTAFAGLQQPLSLHPAGNDWKDQGVTIGCAPEDGSLAIHLSSPGIDLTHIHLRWKQRVADGLLYLGDHWERSYGDLAWRSLVPERVLPWYFATFDGKSLHAYGVRTGAGALCFWQVDQEGISLWLNVANGGAGVQLGDRTLHAATIVARTGRPDEPPFAALTAFCRQMCPRPRLPDSVVYGSNDWYYAYGDSSAAAILDDASLVASLAPAGGPQPFAIMDEGWEQGPPRFPVMAQLAAQIRQRGARPGIWVRPLRVPKGTDPALLMPAARFGERSSRAAELAFDPTHPGGREAVAQQIRRLAAWGFQLIKHDFSTYDLLGQWGSEMGAEPTRGEWSFHDRSKTNAEILTDLYRLIRENAGQKTILLGCNVVGHLSAGIFEMQRTGDDNSGKQWERTRRMGINTIAFRLPQHRTFFLQDPDCVPLTQAVPWQQTRQWLDLVARSGTALIVSVDKKALGAEQRAALKAAFAQTVAQQSQFHPADWTASTTPQSWTTEGKLQSQYDWFGDEGAYPYSI